MNIKKAVILLTNYCNFDCAFCGYRKSSIENAKNVDSNAAKKFLKKVRKEGFRQLTITGGGEPFLALNKVLKIIQFAKKIGFYDTLIITNGSYVFYPNPGEIMKKLRRYGLNTISLSVDYDHLRFTSYSNILQAIKVALDNGIRVRLKCVDRKATYKKNSNLIRQISKDLNGKLIKIPSIVGDKINFLIILPHRFTGINYISGFRYHFCKVPFRKLKNETSPQKIEELISEGCYSPDSAFYLAIDSYLNIFPCISFTSINNPELYSIGKLSDITSSFEEAIDPFMKKILFDRFFFIKMYLKIRKNKKLYENLMKKFFFDRCEFCLWLLKNRKEIEKIPDVSNFYLYFFILSHFHILLKVLKNYIANLIDTMWREFPLYKHYHFTDWIVFSLFRFLREF